VFPKLRREQLSLKPSQSYQEPIGERVNKAAAAMWTMLMMTPANASQEITIGFDAVDTGDRETTDR
jgi:hypothetical protein